MVKRGSITNEIKAKLPISSVISAAVELRGRSPSFTGLCPFHKEKTPSFHVRDNVGRFKCFGCGAAGDAFEFLMRLRGITFAEAVKELAQKAGIALEAPSASSGAREKASRGVLFAQKAAHEYFKKQLEASDVARRYLLEERGLSEKMLRQAALGFGGNSKDNFLAYLQAQGVSEQDAIEAGLLKQGRFSLVPPFLSRIIFPIRDSLGAVVGFGGRAFQERDKDAPKYVNTHSYAHYEKRKSFYGWYESLRAMQKGQVPVLVEGYFDAMAMWALGQPAIALSGTALTTEHIKIVRAMSSRLILCFDADNAGVTALRHALVEIYRMNMEPSLVVLGEKDPGAYLEKRNLEGLRAHMNALTDAMCYLIDQAAITAQASVTERIRQIDLLLPIFASMRRPIVRRQYVGYLAKSLHEDASILWAEIEAKVKSEPMNKAGSDAAQKIHKSLNPEERLLLEITLSAPALVGEMGEILPTLAPEVKNFLEALVNVSTNLAPDAIEAVAKSINDSLWPRVANIVQNRVQLTHDEASHLLKALKEKLDEKTLRASIKRKRSELDGLLKRGDLTGVLNTLREKSKLLSSKKARNKEPVAVEKSKGQAARVAPKPLELPKKSQKISQVASDESYFDAAEDWQ